MVQAASLIKAMPPEENNISTLGAQSAGSIGAKTIEICCTDPGYPSTPPKTCIWFAVPMGRNGIKLVRCAMVSQAGEDRFNYPLT